MRILHVIRSVDPRGGGPIEGVRQLIPAMARRGIETEVLSLDSEAEFGDTAFPAPLHFVGKSPSHYGYSKEAVPWLKRNRSRFDAVIVNGLWQYTGLAVWRALRGTSTPYYVYPHGMLDPWFKKQYPLKHLKKWLYWPWAEYRVLRDASAVLFTTEQERLDARKTFWLYQCQERVTGYGIEVPPGNPQAQAENFLTRFPELKDKRLILFLGRIHEKKGCDILLRAWEKVRQHHSEENFHLVFAGPNDHPFGEKMKELAENLKIGENITWTGMLAGDLKWGSLRNADAFILPSHQENFGISVVEALACGVPVLISNKINICLEIESDRAGIVENDDLEGTVRLLERELAIKTAEKQNMRDAARDCFKRRFDIDKVAKSLKLILFGESA